jgi:hypothetical protein
VVAVTLLRELARHGVLQIGILAAAVMVAGIEVIAIN